MKKNLLILFLALFVSGFSFAQLTGTKTIPGDYTTLASAIADLNNVGVGTGGITFNIAANYTETMTSVADGRISTLTGSASNPIVFQKSGSGENPLLTASIGTGSLDAIITVVGCDFVTFDGIDLQDNVGNTTTLTQMEWGYALLKASTSDGSQNITIKNCKIRLTNANTSSVGIYSNNHLISATSQLVLTAATGANSNLKIFGNILINCYTGISVSGYNHTAIPYDLFDQNNEIGKDGANIITNFGGSTVAMNGIYTIYQNNLTVANNNITGTITGNGQCAGIQLGSSANASLELYENYVSLQYSGIGAFYGIFDNMGTTNTTSNTLNVYNNTVTACTIPLATSGACTYISIVQGAPNYSFHDNTVTNNIYGSATATATGTLIYINLNGNPTTIGNVETYNNDISNNSRIQSALGAGSTYLFYLNNKGNVNNTYNNTVINNTLAASGTSYGFYYLNGSVTKNFYGNTLSDVINANGVFYGLYSGNGTNLNVYHNTFRKITSNAATSVVAGFFMNSLGSTGNMIIHDNFISELYAPNATNAASAVIGMNLIGQSVSTMGVYNNTIYLDANSTGTNFSTSGILGNTQVAFNDFRNNIVVNVSTPNGGGVTAAFRYSAAGLTNYSTNSNNNNFYAGVPATNRVIFYDGTNFDQTLAQFKTRVYPREAQSVTENTSFNNKTTSPYDLHIDLAVPSQVESGGTVISTPVSLTTDFDGDSRYPNSGYPVNVSFPAIAPDMGADEFGGIPSDVTGPTILYTPFIFTAQTGARTLTATITDPNGVPTSGIGLPRVCWKKSTGGTWEYVTGVSIGTNQYTFTFGTGVAQEDTVFYFIVAQDMFSTPAVGSYPMLNAGGYSFDPPTCTTPPTNPSSYYISTPLCGTFSVGVGQAYPTLTAAINDFNNKEITCPTVFELTDATYPSETFPITLINNPGSSSSNTLIIRPSNGNVVSFSGTSTDCIIKFNGTQYVTIDGSKSGANDRSLTFQNLSATGLACEVRFTNNGAIGASNINLKNCILQGSITGISGTYNILMDNGTGKGGYNNIVIDNNFLNTARYGIYIGGPAANPASNIQFTNNTVGTGLDATSIIKRGVEIQYADNVLVQGNEVMGSPSGNNSPLPNCGIYMFSGTNVRIIKNTVHDWFTTVVGAGYISVGINYSTDVQTVGEISNNVIYNIKFAGTSTNPMASVNTGLAIGNNVGSLKVYHNSVYLGGNYLSGVTASSSVCLWIGNNNNGIDFRNNILKNSSQPAAGTFPSMSYALAVGTGNTFTAFDNNDYYVDGIGPNIGYYNSAPQETLANWQSATGLDANSANIDPIFVSGSDMHPTNAAVAKLGVYLPSVPTDIEGNAHTDPADQGAYQVSSIPTVTTEPASYSGDDVILNGTINANNSTVISGFEYGQTLAFGSFIAATPSTVTGSLPVEISATLSALPWNVNYYYRAVGTSGSSIAYGAPVGFIKISPDVTFNVDMSTAQGFVPGTDAVYIAGNFPGATWNEPGSNPALQLAQVGTSLVYSLTLNLPAGNYEYKYFKNAGWEGGEYAGGSNRSALITATAIINDTWGGSINWANLQWPATGSIDLGGTYDVYAQAYIPNWITGPAGAAYGLQAWIGYSTDNTDPNTWTNWVPASYFGQSGENDEFTLDLGSLISTSGTYYYASRFQFGNMPFVYGGFNGGFWDGTGNVSGVLTVNAPTSKTLNLKIFLEGLYAGSGTMNQAQGISGAQFGSGISDQVSVEIHDASAPFAEAYTYNNVDLLTDGTMSISTIPGNISGSYYIVVKHRNSIETWSATPVDFGVPGTISYDFSTAAGQAFGNNLKQEGTDFLIWGGDATQDGIVDGSDMAAIDNASTATLQGYNPEDVNGDGIVDGSDMAVIDNNSTSTIQVQKP